MQIKIKKETLSLILRTSVITALITAIGSVIFFTFFNFNAIKNNIIFDREKNIKKYQKDLPNWQKEQNRIEIPALGIIGRLSFSKGREDEEKLLKTSVVNILGTAKPGEKGNIVITGHSSSMYPGLYKDIFATINNLENGDEVYVYKDKIKYSFEITGKKVVSPDDLSVLDQSKDRLTLITCWPIGTDSKRFVTIAKSVAD